MKLYNFETMKLQTCIILICEIFLTPAVLGQDYDYIISYEPAPIPFPFPISIPRPIFQTPISIMVDTTNQFGLNMLYQHSLANVNNFAFSPCYLSSVLVAIYEGCDGPSALQIHQSMDLPWDRDIIRVGFRDIHRRLRSYFYKDENILNGLILSKEHVIIRDDYASILRFYGYELVWGNVMPTKQTTNTSYNNEDVTTVPTNTPSNDRDVTTVATIAQSPTNSNSNNNVELNNSEPDSNTISNVDDDSTNKYNSPAIENRIKDEVDDKHLYITTTVNNYVKPAEQTITEQPTVPTRYRSSSSQQPSRTTTVMYKKPSEQTTTEVPTIPTQYPLSSSSMSVVITVNSEQPTEQTITEQQTVPTQYRLPSSNQPILTTVNSEKPTEETITKQPTVPKQYRLPSSNQPILTTDNYEKSTEQIITEQPTNPTQYRLPSSNQPIQSTQTENNIDLTTNYPTTMDIDSSTISDDLETTITTIQTSTYFPETTTMTIPRTTKYIFTFKPVTLPPPTTPSVPVTFVPIEDYTRNLRTTQKFQRILTVPPQINNRFNDTNLLNRARQIRRTRSTGNNRQFLTIFGQNKFHGTSSDEDMPLPDTTPKIEKQNDNKLIFHANQFESFVVPFKFYNTALPFASIKSLHSSILELPLDSDYYKLLIIIPDEMYGLDSVIGTLASKSSPSLKDITKQMRMHWVKASVPEFTVKGNVVLTGDLMKMGIQDIFEPGKAEFSSMTDENGIYAKHIEQSVNVNIRTQANNQMRRYAELQQDPIEMIINKPFIFVILDSDLDLALMIGKITNPINSRIM